jgi:hypothetical protein
MPYALLQPFTAAVWPCLAATWLLLVISFRFIAMFQDHRIRNSATHHSWSTAFFVTIGTITQQGMFFVYLQFI